MKSAARTFHAGLVAILIAAASSGCSSWKALRVPPAQYLAETSHTILRVSAPGDSNVVLRAARVSGDTLIGRRSSTGSTVRLPIAAISKVEARRTDWPKTGVGVLATGAALTIYILGVGASSGWGGL